MQAHRIDVVQHSCAPFLASFPGHSQILGTRLHLSYSLFLLLPTNVHFIKHTRAKHCEGTMFMCHAHVLVSCARFMCQVHVLGSCARFMCHAHVSVLVVNIT